MGGEENSGTRLPAEDVTPAEKDKVLPVQQLQLATASGENSSSVSQQNASSLVSLVGREIIAEAGVSGHDDECDWDEGSRDTFGLPWECEPSNGGVVGSIHSRMEVSRITATLPSVATVDQTAAMSSERGQSNQDESSGAVPIDETARRGRRKKPPRGTRNALLLALAVVVILAVGLAVGLTSTNDYSTRPRNSPSREPPEGEIVTIAKEKLCNAAEPMDDEFLGPDGFANMPYAPPTRELDFPFQYAKRWTSLCTPEERVEARGSLQQAMIDKACDFDYTVYLGSEDPDRFVGIREYHICLLPAGEISGDIAPGPVSIDQINAAATQATAFSSVQESSKLFVLRVSSDDVRKLLSNAIEKADKPRLGWYPDSLEVGSAYPYASGLRYQVDLTREPGQKVSGLELLLRNENKWVPFDSPDRPSYVMMTTERALDDFGYMQDIVPIDKTTPGSLSFVDLVVTSLGYSSEWEPPLEDEMSTTSFVSRGGKS